MSKSNVVIMGAGRHMTDKLIPALLKLQKEYELNFIAIVRENTDKGGIKGIDAPVYKSINDIDLSTYNTIIACGPPNLHLLAINHAIKYNKKCFVEKPHILSSKDLELTNNMLRDSMIGYNFNFMPFLNDIDIKDITVGTKGIYMDWGDIFPDNIKEYMYAIHSVIVHPISVLVQKYGNPLDVDILADKSNSVDIKIIFKYKDNSEKSIIFTSDANEFFMNIMTYDKKVYECKKYKSDTYCTMLKYFLSNNDIKINSFEIGDIVVKLIDKCTSKLTFR